MPYGEEERSWTFQPGVSLLDGEQWWDWRDAAAAGVALQNAACLFWDKYIPGKGMSQADLRNKGKCGQIGRGRLISGWLWKQNGEGVISRKTLCLFVCFWFCIKPAGIIVKKCDIKKVLRQKCFRHVFERLLPFGYS